MAGKSLEHQAVILAADETLHKSGRVVLVQGVLRADMSVSIAGPLPMTACSSSVSRRSLSNPRREGRGSSTVVAEAVVCAGRRGHGGRQGATHLDYIKRSRLCLVLCCGMRCGRLEGGSRLRGGGKPEKSTRRWTRSPGRSSSVSARAGAIHRTATPGHKGTRLHYLVLSGLI